MDYQEAKQMADKFYTDKGGRPSASSREDADYWYFSQGVSGRPVYGGIILSVRKDNGKLEIVDMPSHESIMRLKKTSPVNDGE